MDVTIIPHNDHAFADAMERGVGWLRGDREVLRRFQSFPQSGHFAALTKDGKRLGACSIAIYPRDGRAWIGGMVVVEEARRQGLARKLLHVCHAYAQKKGVTSIGLDATADGLHLYESEGYRSVGRCVRWKRVTGGLPPAPIGPAAIYPFSIAELVEVSGFDKERFGVDRSAWLAAILSDNPGRSFVAYDRASRNLAGFVCGQEAFIGPLVADNDAVAAQLLHACESAGSTPKASFMEDHLGALELFKTRGYAPEGATTTRMIHGLDWPWKPGTLYAQGAWALG